MKKAPPRTTRFCAVARLNAAVGGVRTQIIDIGNPAPPAETESDTRAQIVDFG